MAKHNSLSELFTDIAASIRAKTGGTDTIVADNFPEAIEAIEAGSGGIAAGISYDEFDSNGNLTKATVYGDKLFNTFTGLTTSGVVMRRIRTVDFKGNIEEIPDSAFRDCKNYAPTSLPSSLKWIRNYAFDTCESLPISEIPDSVEAIGNRAFAGCKKITISKLPASLTEVWYQVFQQCTSINTLIVHENITKIEGQAFGGCTGLTTVTFKGTPTSIITNAFNGCTNLTVINVPWAEGEVAYAPWGATNATINYNYTGA